MSDNEMSVTNKMSESIAEKTAKLHRLLGEDKDRLIVQYSTVQYSTVQYSTV